MDASVNAHEKNPNGKLLFVWFAGSTAVLKGQGFCYNWDYGTATALDGRRGNHVEVPTILNARHFAGVAARAYSAKTSGQFIELWAPGSYCEILAAATTTIGVGELTCEAGGTYAGYFRYRGFEGEGTAVPLQSVTGTPGTPLACFAKLQEGPPSGLVEDVAANTDGLLDGGATTFMVGGVSYISADISTGGDATFTLADGTTSGLKKAFVCQSSSTNDTDITVTSGIQGVGNADPTTALAGIVLDADLEEITLEWKAFDTSGVWVVTHVVGATLSNS
jgi:hypothetical protein